MEDVIVIEPGRHERNYWIDLWRYRELFRVLAWRDLAVRYKQTVIGAAWAVIRPFITSSSLPSYLAASPSCPRMEQSLTATVAVVWTASEENKLRLVAG